MLDTNKEWEMAEKLKDLAGWFFSSKKQWKLTDLAKEVNSNNGYTIRFLKSMIEEGVLKEAEYGYSIEKKAIIKLMKQSTPFRIIKKNFTIID